MRLTGWRTPNLGSALTLFLGIFVITPAPAWASDNPGYDRPGLGFTPAALQFGDFTLEQGLPDWSRADGITLYNADTLFRLGIGHSLELQLGTGWDRLEGSGATIDGRSDTSLAVKFAPSTTGNVSWGLLGSVELTDGARAFRAESQQYLLGASVDWQRSAEHSLGLYAEAVHGSTDSQLLAINDGWTLTPALGMYVELAAQHLDGIGDGSMGGAGLTWQATPRVQLDIGVRHRLGGKADTWQGGVGFAVFLGRN
ncbi:transporter [Lysobacter sp. 2RAF19]